VGSLSYDLRLRRNSQSDDGMGSNFPGQALVMDTFGRRLVWRLGPQVYSHRSPAVLVLASAHPRRGFSSGAFVHRMVLRVGQTPPPATPGPPLAAHSPPAVISNAAGSHRLSATQKGRALVPFLGKQFRTNPHSAYFSFGGDYWLPLLCRAPGTRPPENFFLLRSRQHLENLTALRALVTLKHRISLLRG
jgi:hypothetical protein